MGSCCAFSILPKSELAKTLPSRCRPYAPMSTITKLVVCINNCLEDNTKIFFIVKEQRSGVFRSLYHNVLPIKAP